jgi:phage terminase large subunit-like protein
MAAANAIAAMDGAGNRKRDKSKATGRIDPLQALVMAIGRAAAHMAEPAVQPRIRILGADSSPPVQNDQPLPAPDRAWLALINGDDDE